MNTLLGRLAAERPDETIKHLGFSGYKHVLNYIRQLEQFIIARELRDLDGIISCRSQIHNTALFILAPDEMNPDESMPTNMSLQTYVNLDKLPKEMVGPIRKIIRATGRGPAIWDNE